MHVAVPQVQHAVDPHGPGTAAGVSDVRRQAHHKLVRREEMTLREAAQQALEALESWSGMRSLWDAEDQKALDTLRAALEQERAEIPKEFDDWWDADRLTQTNPFPQDSPVYWAFEGWHARAAIAKAEGK
jgi:hypothetical protein